MSTHSESEDTLGYKIVRYGAGAAAFCTTIGEAALAVIGMELLLRHTRGSFKVVCDVFAAFFSAVIEGEVYKQNIEAAIHQYFSDVTLQHKIVSDLMIGIYNKDATQKNSFLNEYIQAYINKNADAEASRKTHEEHAILYLMEKDSDLTDEQKKKLGECFTENHKKQFQSELQKKKILLFTLYYVVIPLAAIGSFFTMTYSIATLIAFMGLSFFSHPAIIIVLAVVFSITWCLTLYRTFKRIVYDNLFKDFWLKIKERYIKSTTAEKISVAIATLLMIAVIVCLALSIAGTFWYTSQGGQMLLFHSHGIIIIVLTTIFSSFNSFGDFVFNIKNVVEGLSEGSSVTWMAIKRIMIEMWDENFIQPLYDLFENPNCRYQKSVGYYKCFVFMIAVITYGLQVLINSLFIIFKPIALLLHAFCQGLTTDAAFLIPIPLAAMANAIMEMLGNGSYLFQAPIEDSQNLENEEGSRIPIPPSETDQHEHSNIPGMVLAMALFAPIGITVLFYYWLSGTQEKEEPMTIAIAFQTIAGRHFLNTSHHDHSAKSTKNYSVLQPT